MVEQCGQLKAGSGVFWGMGFGQKMESKVQKDARDTAEHFWNKRKKTGRKKSLIGFQPRILRILIFYEKNVKFLLILSQGKGVVFFLPSSIICPFVMSQHCDWGASWGFQPSQVQGTSE